MAPSPAPVLGLAAATAALLPATATAGCRLNRQQRAMLGAQINEFVWGSVSIAGCLAVIAVIYGHNRDRRALRDRILLGMFTSNIVFSLGFVIPTNLYDQAGPEFAFPITSTTIVTGCAEWIVSPTTYSTAFGLMVAGKFMMAMYELFIVAASVYALQTGASELGRWQERACHVTCVGVGLVVLLHWCAVQNPRWVRQDQALAAVYASTSADGAGGADWAALEVAGKENRAWDDLYAMYLHMWLIFLGLILAAWGYQRLLLIPRRKAAWKARLAEATDDWNRDLWNTSDPHVAAQRKQKRQLLDLQREGFMEVTKPLEPFIAVFVLFAPVAIVLATHYCSSDQNSADAQQNRAGCDVITQSVLSLRSVFTVGVYFANVERRAELRDVGTLGRKVWRRLRACGLWCAGAATGRADLVAAGAAGGRRTRFREGPDEAQLFARAPSLQDEPDPDGLAALTSAGDGGEPGDAISYQLMEE